MEKSKIKSTIESSEAVIAKLREVDDAAELKVFIETSPFATTRAAYSHLINGLIATMSPAELASAFKLPEFVAADLKAAATAELVLQLKEEGGKRAENSAERIAKIFERMKGSKGKQDKEGDKEGDQAPDSAQEAAGKFSQAIQAAFKIAGIDANIETQVINLGKDGGGIGDIVREAVEETFGKEFREPGCGDPDCPACLLGKSINQALKDGHISTEEMVLMASEEPKLRNERTEKMVQEIHAGRPAIDVLIENAKAIRAANTH